MARREGGGLPTEAAPTIPVEYELYVTAYLELDTDRDYLKPIPWTAKAKFCEFYGLDDDQTDTMMAILKRIDNEVILDRERKEKAKASANPTRPSPRHGTARGRR